jgi:hypothetical protein
LDALVRIRSYVSTSIEARREGQAMSDIELTDVEINAIKRLQRAVKGWPKSLVLFGASGNLSVRKKADDGSYGNNREVDVIESVFCDGGDGGDNFDAKH